VNGDVIGFDTGVFPPSNPQTITITSGELPAIKQGNLTIDASNAGVILDGSGIGTPETVLVDDVSLTLDGGPNQITNGDFGAGLRHWRPCDELVGATRSLNTGDYHSSPSSYEWNVVAHVGESCTVYDITDTSDPIDDPFDSSTVWITATGDSTVEVRFWYRYAGPGVHLEARLPDYTDGMGDWWFDWQADWTEAVVSVTLPSNAVGVAFELDHRHSQRWDDGLISSSSGNVIRGLQVVNFPHSGIVLDGAQYNVVGGDNTIGAAPLGQGNLISGNGVYEIELEDNSTMSNTVSGNYIGTDLSGTTAVGNLAIGVSIKGDASYNLIGGTNGSPGGACTGACNLISGNGRNGVSIGGGGAVSNTVSGNYIGTDAGGTFAIPNGNQGVTIYNGASYNVIGGDTPGERNVIGGNGSTGVQIADEGTDYNTVSGNYVGTDATGTAFLGNADDGVYIGSGACENLIGGANGSPGGACTGGCNLISGNANIGISVSGSGTMSNTVSGNYIGTDVNGAAALGNTSNGVYISDGPQFNVVGGTTAAERNIISGSSTNQGIHIRGGHANTVIGNYIGVDASGAVALGNHYSGILINNGSQHNVVGGSTAGERNLISGNDGDGVSVSNSGTASNTVSGNYIGTDVNGTSALGNGGNGVYIGNGASNNLIGGANGSPGGVCSGECNLISGNGADGIAIRDSGTMSNTISGNYIGTDVSGAAALPNNNVGVRIYDSASYNLVGGDMPGERNLISGNGTHGVQVEWGGTTYNTIMGNYIGTDVHGAAALPNGEAGVEIDDSASYNVIGGDNGTPGGACTSACNLISGNDEGGMVVSDYSMNNTVSGNYIGTDASGALAIGNARGGVEISNGASENLIGGGTLGEGNVIAYNSIGVAVDGTATLSNTISHNSIYSNTSFGIDLSDDGNAGMFPSLLTEVSTTTVKGLAVPGATIEVFSDDGDEGRWYHGSTTADGSGAFTFTAASPFTGTHVTATATDADGNTSEFSSPYEPGRDVVVAAIYVPQPTVQVNALLTPTVRVGNGGTVPETFTVTAVITRASDGVQVYSVTEVVTDLSALHYRTLALDSWVPTDLGNYTFEVTIQTTTPDDDMTNDCLTLAFTVADDRVDVWARDNPSDDGREPSVGPIWQSPDVWVRNAADGGTEHQEPINNTDNTVYMRVRNRGTLTVTNVYVTVYWHDPSLVIAQSWWQPIGTVTVTELAPSATIVVSMTWHPQIPGLTGPYHTCLLGVITSTQDPAPVVWDVRGSNNIIQRNVDIIPQEAQEQATAADGASVAGGIVVSTTFSIGNPYAGEQLVDVIVDATDVPVTAALRLDLGELFGRWESLGQGNLVGATVVTGTTQILIPGGGQAEITGIPLAGEELVEVVIEIEGLEGQQVQIDVSERIGGDVLGGITLDVAAAEHKIYLPLVMRSD